MRELIQKVINGEETWVSIPMTPISEFETLIEDLGGKRIGGDTNGWQVDFWEYYTINDKKYCLGGSLHFGDFKFSLEE